MYEGRDLSIEHIQFHRLMKNGKWEHLMKFVGCSPRAMLNCVNMLSPY